MKAKKLFALLLALAMLAGSLIGCGGHGNRPGGPPPGHAPRRTR